MPVVKQKLDGITGSFDQRMGRNLLIEDPNPLYNRIFIDHQGYDLTTLTPAFNKQFMWEVSPGTSSIYGYTGNYYANFSYQNIGNASYGELTRQQNYFLVADTYPVVDSEYLRLGEIITQRGTISTFAAGDWMDYRGGTNAWNEYTPNTIKDSLGTYWHTLDFANWPVYRSYQSPITGFCHMMHPITSSLFIFGECSSGGAGANVAITNFQMATWQYYMYGPDITSQSTYINNKASSAANYTNTYGGGTTTGFTHIIYEDYTLNYLYGFNVSNWTTYFNSISPSFAYTGIANGGDYTAGYGRLYWMGTDNVGRMHLVRHQQQTAGEPYTVYRYDQRYGQLTTVLSGVGSANGYTGRMHEPSNIRRDANNRYVFYSSHLNAAGTAWQPYRFTFDPTNTDNAITTGWTTALCNVAYPGSNTYSSYATIMPISYGTVIQSGYQVAPGGYTNVVNPWRTKPWQFISNGNVYLTMWMVDQYASWLGSATPGGAGTTRWATPQLRTMITYQVGTNNPGTTPTGNADANLTFHSAFTFNNIVDIPKNFMPINANGTLMAVISGGKTNFFTFNNNTGWNSGGVYNTEFRMFGMDNSGRLWGSALDTNNGSLHIVTPSLSLNVVLSLATTNYTFTGTPISTNAIVNVYDSYNNRIATQVTLTTDGVNTTFTNNGLRSIQVATSSSTDTTVPITIAGGGISNIYVAVNNA